MGVHGLHYIVCVALSISILLSKREGCISICSHFSILDKHYDSNLSDIRSFFGHQYRYWTDWMFSRVQRFGHDRLNLELPSLRQGGISPQLLELFINYCMLEIEYSAF